MEEILGMNGVIHAAKVKSRVIEKYGLYLDEEEDASLGHIIGNTLKAMSESGALDIYRDGNGRRRIKYVRRIKKVFINE